MNPIVSILLLSLVAGLGSGIGGLLVIIHKPDKRQFGFLMGFAAGVMITLAFLELVDEAWEMQGFMTVTIGFGGGAVIMLLIDILIPRLHLYELEILEDEHGIPPGATCPHRHRGRCFRSVQDRGRPRRNGSRRFRHRSREGSPLDQRLFGSGIVIAIAITIHNLPEGIAVGASYMHAQEYGYFVALAILLHNIPEGIAVALPLCAGGVCRWDAFKVALISGMAEPVGALLAALFLVSFKALIPGALAFAGGVMAFITLDELIPTAREYGHQHFTAVGIITGMIFIFLLSGIFEV